MTARAFEETPIEEGFASLDAYEHSVVPLDHVAATMEREDEAEAQRMIVGAPETTEEIVIDAARCGIHLLVKLIGEVQRGEKPTCTLQEIGQAIVGTPAPHPNWFEKVCLAKRQDKLLRAAARSLYAGMSTLDNDLYATRVKACRSILDEAYEELKGEGYGFEGDES